MKIHYILWIAGGLLLGLVSPPPHAAPSLAGEYQIKAAFLYNFANFINWPEPILSEPYMNFNICLVGEVPFQKNFDASLQNIKVKKQHDIKVIRYADVEAYTYGQAGLCQILYISESLDINLQEILAIASQYATLTVSEIADFVCNGGMIQLVKKEDKIRLVMAPDQLASARLVPDANLLRLSIIKDAQICP